MIMNRPPADQNSVSRKVDHLVLAQKSIVDASHIDRHFNYEPMLSAHPTTTLKTIDFLGKKLNAPIWISSMTGGADLSKHINHNLARACGEFGLGMGLGSCRSLLDSDENIDQFALRELIGDNLPFYANLGVAQIEQLLERGQINKIDQLVRKLDCDGLIIHVNPLQEYFQSEGDLFKRPPIETVTKFLNEVNYKVIVKEVGQGMGPLSLKALIQLPLAAIEFAGFGGTNFSKLEIMRNIQSCNDDYASSEFINVGHTADQMVDMVNSIMAELPPEKIACNSFIISGGVNSFLNGHYLHKKLAYPNIVGQAARILKYAHNSYEDLRNYMLDQIECVKMAESFLDIPRED